MCRMVRRFPFLRLTLSIISLELVKIGFLNETTDVQNALSINRRTVVHLRELKLFQIKGEQSTNPIEGQSIH